MESNGEVRSDLFPRFYPFVFCERCRFPEVHSTHFSQSKSKIKLLINTFLTQNSDRLISQDEITNLFSSLSSLTPRILVSFFASGLKDPANTGDFAALSDFLSTQVSWDEDIYFGPLLSIAFPVLVSNAKALQYKRELNRNSQKQRSERRNSLRKSSNFMIELPALFLSNEKSPNWPVR